MESKLELIKKMINGLNENDCEIEFSINPIISNHYYYDSKKNKEILVETIRYEKNIIIRDYKDEVIKKVG